MKVLITGSSGQIGTNVGLALLERGDTVHGIDKRANSWTDLIETTLLDLSKCAPTDLPSKTKYDVVLHLAAYAKVFELVEHPERAMENMTMLFNTLDYCRRTKRRSSSAPAARSTATSTAGSPSSTKLTSSSPNRPTAPPRSAAKP